MEGVGDEVACETSINYPKVRSIKKRLSHSRIIPPVLHFQVGLKSQCYMEAAQPIGVQEQPEVQRRALTSGQHLRNTPSKNSLRPNGVRDNFCHSPKQELLGRALNLLSASRFALNRQEHQDVSQKARQEDDPRLAVRLPAVIHPLNNICLDPRELDLFLIILP